MFNAPKYPDIVRASTATIITPVFTYREWLIGMAMQGLCANSQLTSVAYITKLAIEHADYILDALAKEDEQNG